jgi:chromate reductase, NAD(P)H dehydrogenase (quinone)
MTDPIHVFSISGSLRHASFNAALLRAAGEELPQTMTLDVFDHLRDIPPYDDDVRVKGFPDVVADLRARIAKADAILFVTPEYNYSVPGVLKNAIDWASRPPDQPFAGKPVAIMGASPSNLGSARAQYHLRQTCVFLDMHPVNKPEVMVSRAQEKFDPDGKLKDEPTRKLVRDLLVALDAWARRLKK